MTSTAKTTYQDYIEGKLMIAIATNKTTGVTVKVKKINGATPTWPTAAHRLKIVQRTATTNKVEKIGVAAGTTQSGQTVTLGTLTRALPLSDGTDFTGSGTAQAFAAGADVFLAWDAHDAAQTPKLDIANTFSAAQTITAALTVSGTTSYVKVPSLTTTQRNALTAANGMLIYNSTTGQFNTYEGGAWGANSAATVADASTTVAGKVEEATTAEIGAGTAAGGTSARLFVNPSSVVKTSSGAGDENKIPCLDSSGLLAAGFIPPQGTERILLSVEDGVAIGASSGILDEIAFDAISTHNTTAASDTFSHTCTGNNRILFVGVQVADGGDRVTGITYGGVAMTRVDYSAVGGSTMYMYVLVAPASGANDVVVTLSGSYAMINLAASYAGARQDVNYDVAGKDTGTTTIDVALTPIRNYSWAVMYCASDAANAFSAGASTTVRGGLTKTALCDNNGAQATLAAITLTATQSSGNSAGVMCIISGDSPVIKTVDFDKDAREDIDFKFVLPSNYAGETMTAKFYWTASSGSGDVVWGIKGASIGDGETARTLLGTGQTVTDTFQSGKVNVTSATSAMTLSGTPAAGELATFKVYRNIADAADTFSADAKLLAVELSF